MSTAAFVIGTLKVKGCIQKVILFEQYGSSEFVMEIDHEIFYGHSFPST